MILSCSAVSLVVACAVSVYCFSYAKIEEPPKAAPLDGEARKGLIDGITEGKEDAESLDEQVEKTHER